MNLRVLALAVLGLTLVGLTIASLTLHIAGSSGATYTYRMSLLVTLMIAADLIYFGAVALVLRDGLPRHSIWLVLGIGLVLRIILLSRDPFLSSDIYRYVWDGRVQAAGINPYRYVPADPTLASLRDSRVYPMINRPDYARTIYPPVAQMVFAAVGRLSDSVLAMKCAMLAFEALGIACMIRLLWITRLPAERILLYAWNPLVLWAVAADGHVDAIVIGLLGLALLLRARHRDGIVGAVVAAATLVKFFPAAVAPALLRRGRVWRPVLAGGAVIILSYAVYSSVGPHVLGFLPSYQSEEGLNDGSGFWLLAGIAKFGLLTPAAVDVYKLSAAGLLLALALLVARRRLAPEPDDIRSICKDAAILMATLMVVLCPHYPWYFAWLALPSVIAPSRWIVWLSAVPVILYLHPWENDFFIWPAAIYLPAFGLLAFELWSHSSTARVRRLRPGRNPAMVATTALKDPRRYFEEVGQVRSAAAEKPPVCLYLETTNRCNLLCETCPRTFETLEPPADMSWALFTRIVDQVPNVGRVVLHGVGEPMLVKELPRMIRYLKDRSIYVLFNTNGTLLQPKRFQELIDTGLDELRVSLDAADRESYARGARQGFL